MQISYGKPLNVNKHTSSNFKGNVIKTTNFSKFHNEINDYSQLNLMDRKTQNLTEKIRGALIDTFKIAQEKAAKHIDLLIDSEKEDGMALKDAKLSFTIKNNTDSTTIFKKTFNNLTEYKEKHFLIDNELLCLKDKNPDAGSARSSRKGMDGKVYKRTSFWNE